MENLLNIWKELCTPYGGRRKAILRIWKKIHNAYTGKRRYYHNLDHLAHLLRQAEQHRSMISDYDSLRFSIFFHDYIYSSLRKDNETRSAEFAQKKLEQLGYPSFRSSRVVKQIRATQFHQLPKASSDPDLPYFLDFDLVILGSAWEEYRHYTEQIRKEYQIYPAWMYRKGRHKVLTHFLERPRLFFTPLYFERYEFRARENLKRELSSLSGPLI